MTTYSKSNSSHKLAVAGFISKLKNMCMPIEKLCYKRTSKALCSGRTPPTCACTGSSAVAAAFITRHTANELSNGSDFCEDLYVMSADGLLMR